MKKRAVKYNCCSTTGEFDGDWPPSGHKENPGLDDGVKFSTLSAQERVFDGAKEIFVSIGGGKTIFSLVVIIFLATRIPSSSIGAPARPRIPTLF
ncbi:hypothetical protein TNCT_425551 [Trichonephila clavata]|uniref:Uncharacterized protein n=1 Tax=Trichonephila clavata TaxID=2740835 RepID=A0A8X6GH84_TRICU|nr:hypothetical protein TNCT_425551 [Trichonephila clavata]